MPDTDNVKSSQDNNTQSEKSKPQPPTTPDIELTTRSYVIRYEDSDWAIPDNEDQEVIVDNQD